METLHLSNRGMVEHGTLYQHNWCHYARQANCAPRIAHVISAISSFLAASIRTSRYTARFGKIDALGGFLAGFDPDERDCNLSGGYLLHQLSRVEMGKVVSTDIFDRYDGLTTILCHQEESGVHRADPTSCAVILT